jgi:hypothetical protein
MKIIFPAVISTLVFFLAYSTGLNSQVILQLEIFKEVEAVKFRTGDKIHFRTKQYPKEWRAAKIERLLQDEKIILFDDGLVRMEDITEVRVYKPTVYALGLRLMQIGVVWWTYGGIIHLFTENKFTWSTFAIGATSVGIGYILKKWVSKRTLKIKKNANLRMLDISFPSPQEWKSGRA